VSEPGVSGRVFILRGLLAGAAAGAVMAVLFALVDCFGAFRAARVPVEAGEFVHLATRSLAVFIPAFVAAGGALGAVLAVVPRLSAKLARFVRWSLPVVGAIAVFAYLAVWQVSARGALGYVGAAKFLSIAFVGGAVIYGLLKWGGPAMARGGAARAVAPLVVCAAIWGLSVLSATRARPVEGLPETVAAGRPSSPNILLIVLDTVRADHMSCYGYQRQTTPNLDRFAEDARLYTNVLSPACWTLPTHASFFTGLPVSAHGCSWAHPYLDEEFDTLAERLKAAGYQTAGLSSNGFLSKVRSFDQGFDIYWTPPGYPARKFVFIDRLLARFQGQEVQMVAPLMHERLGRWFHEEYDPEEPFFVFLNYIEAHDPYVPASHWLEWATEQMRTKWARRDQTAAMDEYMWSGRDTLSSQDIAEMETLYDEEIAYVDGKVGELLEFLARSGVYDHTLIIVTSDHGEHFGEHHMMGHDASLYEPLVRVPLIVRYPARFEVGRDPAPVQSHDIAPTMLEVAGVDWEPGAEANSTSLLARREPADRVMVAEYLAPSPDKWGVARQGGRIADLSRFLRGLRAIQVGTAKLIRPSLGRSELYDLAEDPLETRDLHCERLGVAAELAGQLDAWRASFRHYAVPTVAAEEPRKLPAADLDAMRGLGYIR